MIEKVPAFINALEEIKLSKPNDEIFFANGEDYIESDINRANKV